MERPMLAWLVLLCQIKSSRRTQFDQKQKKKVTKTEGFVCGRGRWCAGCSRVGPSLTRPFGSLCSAVVLRLNFGYSHRSTLSRTRAPCARQDPHFQVWKVQNEKHDAQKQRGDWGKSAVPAVFEMWRGRVRQFSKLAHLMTLKMYPQQVWRHKNSHFRTQLQFKSCTVVLQLIYCAGGDTCEVQQNLHDDCSLCACVCVCVGQQSSVLLH